MSKEGLVKGAAALGLSSRAAAHLALALGIPVPPPPTTKTIRVVVAGPESRLGTFQVPCRTTSLPLENVVRLIWYLVVTTLGPFIVVDGDSRRIGQHNSVDLSTGVVRVTPNMMLILKIQRWFRFFRIHRRRGLSDSRNFSRCSTQEQLVVGQIICLRDPRNIRHCPDWVKKLFPIFWWVMLIRKDSRCYAELPVSYKTHPVLGVIFAGLLRHEYPYLLLHDPRWLLKRTCASFIINYFNFLLQKIYQICR